MHADIFYIIWLIVVMISSVVTSVINRRLKTKIEEYKIHLDRLYKNNEQVLEYCLRHIIQHSIEVEDYETAKKCSDLIQQLNEKK